MTITTAHLLCSLVACRTRFWALLLPWLNFPPFSINYLNQHLTPHLRSHIGTSTQSCFVTLIIGPSTDVRVGAALHSHLVCAAVAPSNEDYSVLFIPSDLLTDFACPIEWQPLFLYLAASLAYPDLPFLVTTPDYMAGAICTAQGLRSLLNNSCSHILFATADTLVSHTSPLTFHSHRTRWILARLPPASIPFVFVPQKKLAYLCNLHSRINYRILPPAALLLRRSICKTRISLCTVHHTTDTHQLPRWNYRLKYSSFLTISCPPYPCYPVKWKMTLYLPHPIYSRSWQRCTPISFTLALEKVSSLAHSLTPIHLTNRNPAGSTVSGGLLPQHSPSF